MCSKWRRPIHPCVKRQSPLCLSCVPILMRFKSSFASCTIIHFGMQCGRWLHCPVSMNNVTIIKRKAHDFSSINYFHSYNLKNIYLFKNRYIEAVCCLHVVVVYIHVGACNKLCLFKLFISDCFQLYLNHPV